MRRLRVKLQGGTLTCVIRSSSFPLRFVQLDDAK
jgi:hypothetical protein